MDLRLILLFSCLLCLISGAAWSQPAVAASEHFTHGVELAKDADFDAAIAEFEIAYRQSPNFAVLYNLGEAYTAVGRSVEALHAFQQYLEGGSENIGPERRRRVEGLVALANKRIGHVTIQVTPAGSEVFVDGRPLGKSPLAAPVALVWGEHVVNVEATSYLTSSTRFEVAAGTTSTVNVTLTPSNAPLFGQLSLDCELPAAELVIDEKPVMLRRSNEPLLLPVGPHQLRWQRAGYVPTTSTVVVTGREMTRTQCGLRPDATLGLAQLCLLAFDVDAGARIDVDGARIASASLKLPVGPHLVIVRRAGFEDWRRIVTARPGFPVLTKVHLRATPEHARELERAKTAHRTWSYWLAGTGLALLGTSVALYASSASRYDSWQTDRDALAAAIRRGDRSQLATRSAQVSTEAASVQRRDDLALGVGALGSIGLGCALYSWLGAE